MLQDCQGVSSSFTLHWSLANLVLSSQGEEASLLPSTGSGMSSSTDDFLENKIKNYERSEVLTSDIYESFCRFIRCANIAVIETPKSTIGRIRLLYWQRITLAMEFITL